MAGENNSRCLVIGHRGACGYAPENTLPSFEKAITLGVDMIELDVHRCKTGELVVIHDNRVDRTTNGNGYIAELSLAELKKLDAGNGATIPLLREVFNFVDTRTAINIELKGENTSTPVHRLITEYIDHHKWSPDHFMVSSFNHPELFAFHRLAPSIRIGALVDGIPLGLARFAEELGAYAVNASLEFVNREFISDAHMRGFKVFVYTVNHPDDIARIQSLGADGMFSNFPDRLLCTNL